MCSRWATQSTKSIQSRKDPWKSRYGTKFANISMEKRALSRPFGWEHGRSSVDERIAIQFACVNLCFHFSCPILGCPNKQKVAMGHLEDDEEYAQKLHHQRSSRADPLEIWIQTEKKNSHLSVFSIYFKRSQREQLTFKHWMETFECAIF